MNRIPPEFVCDVQSAISSRRLNQVSGPWGKNYSFKKKATLVFYESAATQEFTLMCREKFRHLQPSPVLFMSHRISNVIVNPGSDTSKRSHVLNSCTCQFLKEFLSRSDSPVCFTCASWTLCPMIESILAVIPRLSCLACWVGLVPLLNRIIFKTIKTAKMRELSISHASASGQFFALLKKFTQNCNFKKLELWVNRASDVSYEEVSHTLHLRVFKFAEAGNTQLFEDPKHITLQLHGCGTVKFEARKGDCYVMVSVEECYTGC
ncbi:hypothetical protein L596_022976 [Steinernema carpocapsae]|uniref:Uncharacterized protein n=1 Tax=Steinernema carpocapsae TaxID=34508 RepID=A0A4U5MC81_STECR|nr:hypothetical protein L596_022976 [Steinernema carpocapsae]